MHKFILLLIMLTGCPATLKVEQSADSNKNIEEMIPTEFGVISSDGCDQIAVGSTVCNMVFYDQNKEVWQLHEHTGKVIILDFSAVWCGPCRNAADYVQQIQDDYNGDIEFVTVLVDGATGEPPVEEEINEWTTIHNITSAPVLYGDRSALDSTGITGYIIAGFPTYIFIDRDMKIHTGAVGFNDSYVRDIIDELL
tara:strand:+ start:428 stop:1015 length:588 start_codon:yes stop_codon:yes gene_type:complete